jgi:putative transposase
MTNHVHLLVTPADPTGVSKLMQDVGREYVRYFNNRYHRSGTLWEGRFKSSLVDNERYCLLCYRYIEMNPVRACIVGSPVDYRWSSFAANACNAFDPLVTPHDVWLSLGNDRATCCSAYREFFKDSLGHSQLELIRSSIRKGIPLGSKQFKRRIESRLGIVLGERKVGRPPKID